MCLRAAGEQNALEKAARAVDERRRAHLAELGFTSEAFAPPPPPPAPTAATGVGGYGAPDTDSTGSVDDSGSGGDSDGGGGYGDGFAAALPSDPVDAARDGPAAAAPGAASPSLSGTTYVCAAGPMGATALHLLVARKLRDPHSPVIAIAAALLAHGADANAKDHVRAARVRGSASQSSAVLTSVSRVARRRGTRRCGASWPRTRGIGWGRRSCSMCTVRCMCCSRRRSAPAVSARPLRSARPFRADA